MGGAVLGVFLPGATLAVAALAGYATSGHSLWPHQGSRTLRVDERVCYRNSITSTLISRHNEQNVVVRSRRQSTTYSYMWFCTCNRAEDTYNKLILKTSIGTCINNKINERYVQHYTNKFFFKYFLLKKWSN